MNRSRVLIISFSLAIALVFAGIPGLAQDTEPALGQVRFLHLVSFGPAVDVLINGSTAVSEDGTELINIRPVNVTGYVPLEAGTHALNIVPNGGTEEDALIDPVEIEVEAGHTFSLVLMGQATDPALSSLLIDETTAAQSVRSSPVEGGVHILINNLADTPQLEFSRNDEILTGVPQGEYVVSLVPVSVFNSHFLPGAGVELPRFVEEAVSQADEYLPGDVLVRGLMGNYAADTWSIVDARAPLDARVPPPGFLEQLSWYDVPITQSGHTISFTTLQRLMAAAGITDADFTLEMTLFAPTDDAFATLPEGTIDQWLTDTTVLREVLLNHVIPVRPPLQEAAYETNTLIGDPFSLFDTFLINDGEATIPPNIEADHRNIVPITAVIIPLSMRE